MTVAPAVSVIMAAYNGAHLIGETLASLSAQTLGDFEVLVVDDCSTDDTRAVVRAWPDTRVRLIEATTNGGPVRARNLAFAQARGRHVAGLDQDDICLPHRFARQVAFLDAHPDVAMVAAAARLFDVQGRERPTAHAAVSTPALIDWLLHIQNPLVWSTAMIRGAVARRLDPFTDPACLYAEDFDLYHRLRAHGPIARIDDVLLRYRSHEGGASQRHRDTMIASAAGVLTRAWRRCLGDDAGAVGDMLARYIVAGDEVPDRPTLHRLGTTLTLLQAIHLGDRDADDESRRLVKWETARLWWRIVRNAVRSGTITMRDAVAVRPDHLGLGHAGVDDMLLSGVVGHLRRVRARATAG
ncbi:glycosyltransferase family 2 protein [Sphingomonas sp.]|uniref:glycosyltransferase family 2 protein n=1 Tax=Sphingomonas sp. TaxID=28214 RepID=UPI002DD6A4BF|nr:glycosyltransferase family A protein [Sphingomonas sp.]